MPTTAPAPDELLVFHFECLQGMYFSSYEKRPGGHLLLSNRIADPYYNFFAPTDASSLNPEIENTFETKNRIPAIYLTPLADSWQAKSETEPWASDAWLVGTSNSLGTESRTVPGLRIDHAGLHERDVYVDTFMAAYSGSDPSDIYGQLDPAYADALRDSFDRNVPGYQKYYVLASQDNLPVGVATLFTAGPLAGVYGVGTIPSHRRQGIGEQMMAYLAEKAFRDGAETLLLQTEAGSPVRRWYEKLGYRHVFTAQYLILSSPATAANLLNEE